MATNKTNKTSISNDNEDSFCKLSKWYRKEEVEKLCDELNIGDLIEFNRGGFSHWAIYIGEGDDSDGQYQKHVFANRGAPPSYNPLHLISRLHSVNKAGNQVGGILLQDLSSIAKDSKFRINNLKDEFYGKPLPIEKIVQRCRSDQMSQYNVLFSNCENFVYWARNDVNNSRQATSFIVFLTVIFVDYFYLLPFIALYVPLWIFPVICSASVLLTLCIVSIIVDYVMSVNLKMSPENIFLLILVMCGILYYSAPCVPPKLDVSMLTVTNHLLSMPMWLSLFNYFPAGHRYGRWNAVKFGIVYIVAPIILKFISSLTVHILSSLLSPNCTLLLVVTVWLFLVWLNSSLFENNFLVILLLFILV